MKLSRKTMMILGGVLLVIFLLSGYWFLIGRNTTISDKNEEITPSETVIPTIDSSVKVDLTALNGKKEVLLSVVGIPRGISSLEYILSYETTEGGLQGVNSIAEITGSDFEKKITLGTCSSGTCTYHSLKNKIKVELLFKGDGPDKYFTKEYEL